MKKHILKINSDINEIHEVEKFVENICDYYNINNSYFGNIIVAVTEAVENAIFHGNKSDPQKKVTLTLEPNKKGIVFIVEDEGDGFNHNLIPDPTDIKNQDKKGSGIFLIKNLTDEVKFLSKGRKIILQFNITSISREVYANRMKNINQYFNVNEHIRNNA